MGDRCCCVLACSVVSEQGRVVGDSALALHKALSVKQKASLLKVLVGQRPV